jgi:hypothetical protein
MPADQHSVHRINEADSESGAIQLYIIHSRCLALQGFCVAIPIRPQPSIHITVTPTHQRPTSLPTATMWMEVEAMTNGGLLVRSSHGLLP